MLDAHGVNPLFALARADQAAQSSDAADETVIRALQRLTVAITRHCNNQTRATDRLAAAIEKRVASSTELMAVQCAVQGIEAELAQMRRRMHRVDAARREEADDLRGMLQALQDALSRIDDMAAVNDGAEAESNGGDVLDFDLARADTFVLRSGAVERAALPEAEVQDDAPIIFPAYARRWRQAG